MATILIVDDDAPIRTVLRDILEKDGHQIREAANGRIGLMLYREAPAGVASISSRGIAFGTTN